jgi:predicted lipoprotein with Yx(FWY)xxD motif
MRTQRRLAVTGATAAAAAMLLAGCNGFGNGSTSTGNDSSGQTGIGDANQAAQSAPAPTTKIKWTLMTASTKKLGRIMVNGQGMTLYRFDNDTASPSASKCLGECAKKWPPVTINTTNLVLKGFDATLLGRIKRANGTWQLTLRGWPLYTYAGDTKSGVWKGQGLQGKWFVAAANGTKALAKKSASGTGSSSTGSSGTGSSGGSGSGGSGSSGGSGGGDTGGGYGGGGY